MEYGIGYLPKYPRLPLESTSPIYGIPCIQRCMGGLLPGILREVVQQVISVPYDPSSNKYEANPVDANPRIKVKQEGVHRDARHAEKSVTNIPAVQAAAMNGCPKVSDSPSRKQKGLLRGP
jgi:hypothetical protein